MIYFSLEQTILFKIYIGDKFQRCLTSVIWQQPVLSVWLTASIAVVILGMNLRSFLFSSIHHFLRKRTQRNGYRCRNIKTGTSLHEFHFMQIFLKMAWIHLFSLRSIVEITVFFSPHRTTSLGYIDPWSHFSWWKGWINAFIISW